MMKNLKEWFMSSQALLSMLLVQVFATEMQLLSRVVLVQGTFIFALLAYRHLVAAICVAPLALYLERGLPKKFNWRVWFWLFVSALPGMTIAFGCFMFLLWSESLRDTSATYVVNFLNLVPIFTFIVSIICRMENVRIQTWCGQAKCAGAILCVGGALVSSMYKGKEFYIHGRVEYGTLSNCVLGSTVYCCYVLFNVLGHNNQRTYLSGNVQSTSIFNQLNEMKYLVLFQVECKRGNTNCSNKMPISK